MKNSILRTVGVIAFAVMGLTSCSDDDGGNGGNGGGSRTIKYEVTGNFVGDMIAIYPQESGAETNVDVQSLPWTKEVTYAASADYAGIGFSGNSGTPGQTVTIKIYRGNELKSTSNGTANEDGNFYVHAPDIIF